MLSDSMGWSEKYEPTPFDNLPLEGLFFLYGDLLAARGEKYPMICFPSGSECDLWETSDPKRIGVVHIFGEMDLPLGGDCEEAFTQAKEVADACGYAVRKIAEDRLEVWGHDTYDHFILVYDNPQRRIVDVIWVDDRAKKDIRRPTQELLPQDVAEKLPSLYSGEKLGLNAVAQVKFFTPDGAWSWYASEYDGEDICFGLVVGFEIELGYFSIAELKEVRGALGLPIERDRFFTPQTLGELQASHLHERGAG